MRWDNLMKPGVRSEVLLPGGAVLIFLFLLFLTLFLLATVLTVIHTQPMS